MITDFSVDNPPTRPQVWKMLVEAWGYLTGGIGMTDIASTVKLLERQVAFYEAGHNHNLTTDAGGKPLVSTGIFKRHFDLQECDVLWGNYYVPRINASNIYAIVAGSGSCDLHSTTTNKVFGTVKLDYNLFDLGWATTEPCQLDLRNLGAANLAAPFDANWTLAFAYACPVYTGAVDPVMQCLINQAFGFDTGATSAPYMRFVAATTVTGTLQFDYKCVIRKLT